MADANPLQQGFEKVRSILESLKAAAQPRPDLMSPGSTGDLVNPRPYTYAGRVGNALDKETPESILARVPMAELETGGRALTSPADLLGAMSLGKGIYTLAGTAFHGSPFKFDKFDPSKIGTGEGAQVYGHGLYFAENQDVAKNYANALARRKDLPEGIKLPESLSANEVKEMGALGQAMQKKGNLPPDQMSRWKELYGKARAYTDAIDAARYKPNLYQVEIPDQHIEKMLDWDKPLSQQAPEVQKALKASGVLQEADNRMRAWGIQEWRRGEDYLTGEQLIKALGDDKAKVSAKLNAAGIPGIKYLDQGSRTAGKGTSNYVVFDPAILTETKRIE